MQQQATKSKEKKASFYGTHIKPINNRGKKIVYNQDLNAGRQMQYKNCYISLTIINCTYVAIM